MITPRFSCSQTSESVVISIYCPSIRAADVEIHVDETLFTIHINPYFLRLNFSHPLVEDDTSTAKYDASSGYLTVTLTKENKGQTFQDLDLLAKLLAPRPAELINASPVVEVLSSEEAPTTEDDLVEQTRNLSIERQEILKASENDWQSPQKVLEAPSQLKLSPNTPYGFLDMYSGYFKHVEYTENEVNELGGDAETSSIAERRRRRIKHEDEKFDEEYYMADYADDECIRGLLDWVHPHVSLPSEGFQYTEAENLAMLRLPRKEYLVSHRQKHELYLTLVTLLFSYSYESRTNQLDPTPESAWTICSLTSAFSALDPPRSSTSWDLPENKFTEEELVQTLVPSYRRSLCFPLYRSFILAEACRNDVGLLLSKGKRTVIRCLLEMKHILDHHEVYYVYSKIWLDDFCAWIQRSADDEVLESLGKVLLQLKFDKAAVGWDLGVLEAAASQNVEDERTIDSDDESIQSSES